MKYFFILLLTCSYMSQSVHGVLITKISVLQLIKGHMQQIPLMVCSPEKVVLHCLSTCYCLLLHVSVTYIKICTNYTALRACS